MEDHLHVLFNLHRTVVLSEIVRELKVHTTLWFKRTYSETAAFAWQKGYGAFGVSINGVEGVIDYIQRQDEHHKNVTWMDEYRELLREGGLEWDERYLWD